MTKEAEGRAGDEGAPVSDEALCAFVDGESDPAEASRIETQLRADPDLRRRRDDLLSLRDTLREATSSPLREAPPERLAALFETSRDEPREAPVVLRGSFWSTTRRQTHGFAAGLAVAASLALAVLAWPGSQESAPSEKVGLPALAVGVLDPEDPLTAALTRDPNGSKRRIGDAEIMQLGTFLDRAGRPCREFEFVRGAGRALEVGVACRAKEVGWHVEIAVVAEPEPGPGGALRPAMGAGADAVAALLDRLGAGPMLGGESERALIESGWPATAPRAAPSSP